MQQGEDARGTACDVHVEIGHAPPEQRVSGSEVVVDVETGEHPGEAPARLVHLQQLGDGVAEGLVTVVGRVERDLRHGVVQHPRTDRMPYMLLFQVLLPFVAPVIDVFAVYGILFVDRGPVIGFWLGFTVLQLIVGIYAFRLDHEKLRPLWTMPLQQFLYRQMMYLVVIHSVVTAVVGAPLRWHKMNRTGDFSAAPTRPSG